MVKKVWLPVALGLVVGACLMPAFAADKLSTVTPVGDLVSEVEVKIKDLETALTDSESYTKSKKKAIPQSAGLLAVLAQAIAEHDEESAIKKSAADLRDSALAIVKAGSLEDAKKALENAKAAAGGKAGTAKGEFAWDKLIGMDELMSEVSSRSGKLRKAYRKAPEDHAATSRDASVLAVLALCIEADTHEVKDKGDLEKWKKYAQDMRKSMTEIAAALKAKDDVKGKALFIESSKSCNGCHTDIRDK